MNNAIAVLLSGVLGGGSIGAVLTYLTKRKTTQIDYTDSVAKTLTELNSLLKTDNKSLRQELKEVRDENLELWKRVRSLEARVAGLEKETR